jgi:TolB protein
MGSDGQGQRPVVSTHFQARQVAWSADGTRLFYSDDGQLRTVEVASGAVVRLGVDGHRPALSPDGTRIAYMAPGPNGIYYRDADWGIHVADSAGTNPMRLADGQFVPLSWSPDGKQLLVTNGAELALVDLESPTIRLLGPRGSGGAFRP